MSYHGEQLVKLRNPWGRDVWTGQWSPTSDKYKRAPEELLRMLDMKRSGDKDFTHGEFVMTWADFVAVFDNVCLAVVQPRGWTEAAVTGRWPAAPSHMWHFRTRVARERRAVCRAETSHAGRCPGRAILAGGVLLFGRSATACRCV